MLDKLGSYLNRLRPEVLDDIPELDDPSSDSSEAPA
jgi:hypothetical protein